MGGLILWHIFRLFFASIARGLQLGWDLAAHIDTSRGWGLVLFSRGDTLTERRLGYRGIIGFGGLKDRSHAFVFLRSEPTAACGLSPELPWQQCRRSEKKQNSTTEKRPKVDTEERERERREDKLVLLAKLRIYPLPRQSTDPQDIGEAPFLVSRGEEGLHSLLPL